MEKILAKVESVNLGLKGDLGKEPCAFLQAELDGFVGDRHRSYSRQTWAGDKQAEGTKRRNERQWSAVSVEELAEIQGLKKSGLLSVVMVISEDLRKFVPSVCHFEGLISQKSLSFY